MKLYIEIQQESLSICRDYGNRLDKRKKETMLDRQTGYPSVDKPWLKYYSAEAINAPLPECSIYEYMLENNKNYPADIAINYLGRKITYKELFENIDKTGPNTMLGYYQNDEETNNILRMHSDGKIWVHSGDWGHIDEDGFLFIDTRIKRIIVRHDGFKVFPSYIENVILKDENVTECCAVESPDEKHAQGMLPVVFAVFSEKGLENMEKEIEELLDICEEELPEYAQPKLIKPIEKLPLTPIGKIDYKELEVWAQEF